MISKRGLIAALVVPAVVSASLVGVASAAGAAPAASSGYSIQQGMNLIGFDAAVAKAHGYKIVTYANGDQQSVPIDAKSSLPKSQILHRSAATATNGVTRAVAPRAKAAYPTDYNQVVGNCGLSWIRVAQTGPHKVSVASGFRNLPEPAFDWSWTVSLTDRNGTSHQYAGGPMMGTSASRVWQNLNQYTYTFDYVSSGLAFLIDGSICHTGSPGVSIYIA